MKNVLEKRAKWLIKERSQEDIVDQILVNRGIDLIDKENFLHPDYEKGLYDPFLLDGMDKAVERILKAIENDEKIGIFGDYDADGIPATALLYHFLRKIGANVEVFIPKREEGYGLNRRGIEKLAFLEVKLIITVDLGVTGKEEVEYVNDLGLDIIITDHHEVIEELFPTKAVSVIDPKMKCSKYPFRELSGTAVAFKLASAIAKKTKKLSLDQMKWYLDLVGISTFCDIVPLKSENRLLAKYGLVVLSKTRRKGLKKLYEVANIDPAKINPYVVGYLIGPRLNAPGRMGDCSDALNLLICGDDVELGKIAMRLEKINTDRQEILKKVFNDANEEVLRRGLDKNKVIFVSGEGWPDGIVGLVAGRLMERYCRPTIVVGLKDGIGRGSARSMGDFSMVKALNECKKYLIKHGGHEKAAGLTIAQDKMEKFYTHLLKIANTEISDEDLFFQIEIDGELKPNEINWQMYKKLEKLEPYGLGNARPVFVSYGLQIKKMSSVGKNREHAKVVLGTDENDFNGIYFGFGEKGSDVSEGDKVNVVYTLDKDDWRGEGNLQLKVLDVRCGETAKT